MFDGSLEGDGGAKCDVDGLGANDLPGEPALCREEAEVRGFSDASACDSSVPAEEGLESLDTTLLIVANDTLRAGNFSAEGALRSSVLGCPVGVTARLLAAELPPRAVIVVNDGLRAGNFSVEGALRCNVLCCPVGLTARLLAAEFPPLALIGVGVGVTDRAIDRGPGRVAEVAEVLVDRVEAENVAARVSPMGGVLALLEEEGGVLAFGAAVGVTGLPGAENVLARVNAVGVADLRDVDGAPTGAVGVAGRRIASLDLEGLGGFDTTGPARLVAEVLANAIPVGLLSSSFGFPGIDMLVDLPLA